MRRSEIADLKAGDPLYVRKFGPFGTKVYDADVIVNDRDNTQVAVAIYYPGQIDMTVLYYSGRTPLTQRLLVTDFFRSMPTEDHIGEYEYRSCRSKYRKPAKTG